MSGELAIVIKNYVYFKWKEIKNTYDTLLSITIDGRSVNQDKDLIVTTVYMPPPYSRYCKPEQFEEMDDMLLNHTNNDYHNLLCREFNAHTGSGGSSYGRSPRDGTCEGAALPPPHCPALPPGHTRHCRPPPISGTITIFLCLCFI